MKKQQKSVVLGVVAVVVLLIGIKAFSSDASQTATVVVNGSLAFAETNWDFGDIIMSDGVVTKQVTFTNDSATPITVTQMETSCMCTTAQIVHEDGSKSGLKGMVGHGGGNASLSEIIEVGETATLLVNFDPNAHGPEATGPITRTVMLRTNSQAQSQTELTFSGNVLK
ncbi:MAG: DUF1573 domain-containing protein [Patescibacteria group bacterium]